MKKDYDAFGEMDSALYKVMFAALFGVCWMNDLTLLYWVGCITAFIAVLVITAFLSGVFNLGEHARLAFYFITLGISLGLPFLVQ